MYSAPSASRLIIAAQCGDCETVSLSRNKPVNLNSFDQIRPEQVRWLWRGRVPLGKITILQGDPGIGKSGIGLDIASRASAKDPMPDGSISDLEHRADVLLLSAEDGPADTIRPRLDALDEVNYGPKR